MKSDINRHKLLPLVISSILILGFILAYRPVFEKLFKRWAIGDNSYCYLVVPLFLYLCQEKARDFRFLEFSWNYPGLLPLFLSIGLIVIGELGSVETLLYTGIWGCLVGMCIILYGWRTKFLVFPFIILFFVVPLPPFINRILTFKLKMAASSLSVGMLRAIGVSVMQEGNVIDLGLDQLQVADACSGLRYFMPMILMALLIGYFFSKGWWRRTVLLVLVVPLTVFLNGLRIFATGLLTINGHKELAHGFSHDFAGWLGFMVAGAMLVLAAFLLRKIWPYPQEGPEEGRLITEPEKRYDGYLRPVILAGIICLLFAGSGYALRGMSSSFIQPKRTTFDSFPMKIGRWEGKRSYLSKKILNALWADDYLYADYHKKGSPNVIHLFIPYYKYQGTRHTAHAPQSCLLGGGWAMANATEYLVKAGDRDKIKVMLMLMEKGNARLLSSYFFFERGRVITSPWLNKFYLIWDSITRRRTDGALVRVEMPIASGQSVEDVFSELEDFLTGVWPLLPDYVPE